MDSDSIVIMLMIGLLIGLFILSIWLYCFLPISMAKKRGRSVLGSLLLFWFTSPIIGIIILLILGDSNEKIRQDIMNERQENQN